jgi:hypothetical protein
MAARQRTRGDRGPDRGFDAIIVGEAERAFTGTQLLRLATVLLAQGCRCGCPSSTGLST